MLVDKNDGNLVLPNLSNNEAPSRRRGADSESRNDSHGSFFANSNRKYSLGNADDMKNYEKGFIGVGKAMLDHQSGKKGKDPYADMTSGKSNKSRTLQSPARNRGVSTEK